MFYLNENISAKESIDGYRYIIFGAVHFGD